MEKRTSDMREKKWIDCPACGAKNSMRKKRNVKERFNPSGYPALDISGLDGESAIPAGKGSGP